MHELGPTGQVGQCSHSKEQTCSGLARQQTTQRYTPSQHLIHLDACRDWNDDDDDDTETTALAGSTPPWEQW